MSTDSDLRADRISASATGFGIGLITFMLTWTIGARIAERILDTPTDAYVAMGVAFIGGIVSTTLAARRLRARVEEEAGEAGAPAGVAVRTSR